MIKKLIACMMACTCLLGAVGCASNDTTDNSGEEGQGVDEKVMLSFDSYDELLSTLMLSAPFGGTDFCSDKNYVVEGKNSLRVAPEGEYGTINSYPTMTIYTDGESFNGGDFSDLDNMSFYVYNANDVELHLQMTFNAYDNQSAQVYAPAKMYTLTPNSWNKVVYDFTDGSLRKSMNHLKLVNHIDISFMEYKQNKTDEPYIYYFDCLQGKRSKTEIAEYQSSLSDGQIYNFEKLQDKYLVLGNMSNKNVCFMPITSISHEKVFTTEGNQSLKVEYPCVRNDRVRNHSTFYTYLYFDMTTATAPASAEAVSMDVINANDFTVTLSVTACDDLGQTQTTEEYVVQPHTKQTFVIDYAELAYLRLNFLNRVEPIYSVLYVDNIQFI